MSVNHHMTTPHNRLNIDTFIHGIPKGQPRARAFVRGGHVGHYTPPVADGWRSRIATQLLAFRPQEPSANPFRVHMSFYMPRPKSHFKRCGLRLTGSAPFFHTQKPDIDNLVKAVMDELTQLGLWRDDSQVAALGATRAWVSPGDGSTVPPSGLHLRVTEVQPIPPAARAAMSATWPPKRRGKARAQRTARPTPPRPRRSAPDGSTPEAAR